MPNSTENIIKFVLEVVLGLYLNIKDNNIYSIYTYIFHVE